MEYFDQDPMQERKNDIYELNKKKYLEKTQKQIKLLRMIMTIVFTILGILFLVVGITMSQDPTQEDDIACIIGGGVFLFIAILFFIIFTFAKPTDKTFDRIQNRVKRYGVYDVIMMSSMLETQEGRINELEARIDELECDLERIRKK